MSLYLKGVSVGYKSASLVSSIDAELNSGDFICLIGRNGTGKSTMLRTIARLISPVNGNVECADSIGIVLTQVPDLKNTTVFELVSYGRIPHQNILANLRQDDIEAIEQAIETVGIINLKDRKICELSDGEKQKAMIARALAQGTDIILLDEPSAFLDYESKHELMQLLRVLAHERGKAVLLSSHDIDLVRIYADKVWQVIDGRLRVLPKVGNEIVGLR